MVMWVALGVLIIMSLAGLAMLRQMGGGVSIAGNVAFKQSATTVADLGTETARAWFKAQSPLVLQSDLGSAGYYSSWGSSVDPTDASWKAAWDAAPEVVDAATGNRVKYVINRLCETPGKDANEPGQRCSAEGGGTTDKGTDGTTFTSLGSPYYRITTQVTGPRNTVSYTQVVTN